MAIRDLIQDDEKLHLVIDNRDLEKLDQALNKWSFKDYQSPRRFSVSLVLLAEDKSISIKRRAEIDPTQLHGFRKSPQATSQTPHLQRTPKTTIWKK